MSTAPIPVFDELVTWATPDALKPDVIAAKAEWFDKTGEVFDDDRQLELRMAAFLEHYVCDRVSPAFGMTPARARYELALKTETPERALTFRAFTETIHSLFEVRRLTTGTARLRALFSQVDIDVVERRHLVGLSVGDVLEIRLVPSPRGFHFLPSYCWHPKAAGPLIRQEAERRRKSGAPELDLIWDAALRSLKVERYRQIAVEKIYDFSNKTNPTPTGRGAKKARPPPPQT